LLRFSTPRGKDDKELVEEIERLAKEHKDDFKSDLRNLAFDMDEDDLNAIAEEVIGSFRSDLNSRSEWDRMHAQWISLYFQQDRPLNPPWQGASDESIPLLTEAVNQWQSRASQLLFGAGPNVISARPTGNITDQDRKRAERIGKHMGWQLFVRDDNYRRNKDRLLMALPLHGSFFTKTYFDGIKQRNVVENVKPDALVIPYGHGPRNIEDVERKTHIINQTVNYTRQQAVKGWFVCPAEPSTKVIENSQIKDAADRAEGMQAGTPDYNRDVILLEQHTLLDLDQDGIAEPYIVTVDLESEKVLRLAVRYETDEDGEPIAGKAPIEYFTHYVFLENPDGFYGLGYGHLIGQLNRAINKHLRQATDAATLANVLNNSGFVRKTAGISKGTIEVKLGKYTSIDTLSDDIRRDFLTLQHPGPNQAQVQLIEMLKGAGERLAMVTDMVTGQPDKVYQPTAVLALIEQALQTFSSSSARTIDAWGRELRKLYRLNSLYLPDEEYWTVLDQSGNQQTGVTGRTDYEGDLQIIPAVDPKLATLHQKLAKAQAVYEFAKTNPSIARSPVHFYNASKRYLETLEVENIDEILPKPPTEAETPAQQANPLQVMEQVIGQTNDPNVDGGQNNPVGNPAAMGSVQPPQALTGPAGNGLSGPA
jgi:chaperonin GroES